MATFFTKRVQDFKNIEEFISYIILNLNHLIKIDQPINYKILTQAALLYEVSSTNYA
jgi:hypothetical protein